MNDDIKSIMDYLICSTKGYRENTLKWQEKSKLKSDLMINKQYWAGVNLDEINLYLLDNGMRKDDAVFITECIDKALRGKRLIPDRSYKNFVFKHEI